MRKSRDGRKGRRENEEEGEERKESSSKRNPLPRVEAIPVQTYERGKSNMMLLKQSSLKSKCPPKEDSNQLINWNLQSRTKPRRLRICKENISRDLSWKTAKGKS